MLVLNSLLPSELNKFFEELLALENFYVAWVGDVPKLLVINPDIIGALAKVEGFYQRPELEAKVTLHAPVVRYLKLKHCVVTIQEDYDELFLHFE
jgi:hypothetical protein